MLRLQSGSSRKWDLDADRFTAKILAWDLREFKDEETGKVKKSYVLTFQGKDGETFERNSTTSWDRWMGMDLQGKGKAQRYVKVAPQIKVGDVVHVVKIEQRTMGKRRFFNFTLDVLNGKDRPKWAR